MADGEKPVLCSFPRADLDHTHTRPPRVSGPTGHYDYNPNVNCGQGLITVYDGYHCGTGF